MATDNSVLKFSDLIASDGTFEEIINNIHILKKELKELAAIEKTRVSLINPNDEKALTASTKEVNELSKAMKMLQEQEASAKKTKKELEDLTEQELILGKKKKIQNKEILQSAEELQEQEASAKKTKKELKDLTEQELILREKEKIQNRERVQSAKQLAILRNTEKGSIASLRAELSIVTLKWKNLSKEERNNGKVGKNLVLQKKRLTEELKKLEKQTGDNRRNVGNYTSALGKLGKATAAVFIGRNIAGAVRRLGQAFITLVENNKDTNESAKSLFNTISSLKEGLTKLGLKIIDFVAEPINNMIRGLNHITKNLLGFSILGQKASEKVKDLQMSFNAEIETLKRGNISQEARNQLIKDINKKYKDYLPKLISEKDSIDELTDSQNKANKSFEKRILLLASEEEMIDLAKRKLKLLREQIHLEKIANKTSIEAERQNEQLASSIRNNMNNERAMDFVIKRAALASKANEIAQENLENNKKLIEEINKDSETIQSILKIENLKTKKIKDDEPKDDDSNEDQLKDENELINIQNELITRQNELKSKILQSELDLKRKLKLLEIENLEDRYLATINLEKLRYDDVLNMINKSAEDYKKMIKEETEADLLALNIKDKNSEEFKKIKQKEQDTILDYQKLTKELIEKEEEKHLKKINKISQQFKPKITPISPRKIEDEKLINEQIRNEVGLLSERQKKERDFNRMLADEKIKSIKDENKRKRALELEYLKRKKEDILSNEEITWNQKQQLLKELEKQNLNSIEENRTKELFEKISEISKNITTEMQKAFEKQSEIMGKLVEEQANAVETQSERAKKGLSNTLKFEQEELAKREAEKIRAEKRAQQAAEIIALYNLVSNYAANGDKNALQRGLVDFTILSQFKKILGSGFKYGGYTGNASTDTVTGHVHGKEYVVNAKDTKKYNLIGKTGLDFGDTMSDYFTPKSILLSNNFEKQQSDFDSSVKVINNQIDFSDLQNEVVKLRKSFERIPRNQIDVVWLTDYVIEITQKTISGRMAKIKQEKRRLK